MVASFEKTYHLFRSMQRANAYLRSAADEGGAFGVCATTPTNFVSDLAKMVGDNRKIVNATDRMSFMLCAIAAIEDEDVRGYFEMAGVIDFMCNFVKAAAGCDTMSDAISAATAGVEIFEEYEAQAILLADTYYSMLAAYQMVELGTLAADVSTKLASRFNVVVHDEIEMIPAVRSCVKFVASKYSEEFREIDYSSLAANRHIELDVLSGERGVIEALLNAITPREGQDILIVCPNPMLLFEQIAPALESAKIDCKFSLQTRVSLSETGVGQGLCDAYTAYDDDETRKKSISSLLHNPTLDISYFNSLFMEEQMLAGDSRVDSPTMDKLMDASFNAQSYMKAATQEGEAITASLECIDTVIEHEVKMSEARRRLELNSLKSILGLYKELNQLGFTEPLWPEIFDILGIKHTLVAGKEDAATSITITNIGSSKSLAEASFDVVICTDLTTNAFSAADKFDALNTIFEQLQIEPSFPSIKTARLDFASFIEASRGDIVMMYPLRSIASDGGNYPCAPLQEMLFSLTNERFEEDNIEDVTNKAGFSYKLYGEDGIYRSMGLNASESDELREVGNPSFELVDKANFKDYLKTITNVDGDLVLSPSAIEKYCNCPYKWFYESRLKPEPLEWQLGSLEFGNIAHGAYEKFYRALADQGVYRLEGENAIETYRDLFLDCFEQSQDEELSLTLDERDNNVLGILDWLELTSLRDECLSALQVHEALPEDYVIAEMEYSIKPEDKVKYAGVVINGRLDRLDVSKERDSFLVIDYKGSLKDHDAGCKSEDSFVLPKKIQALIYASVISKLTNKKCDGAVYISYHRPENPDEHAMSGSIQFDAWPFCGKQFEKNCTVNMEMADYLEMVESAVKARLEALADGDIKPNPIDKSTCKYCQVKNCPMRM